MRWPIAMYLAGAAVALGLILVGTDASFFAALILICTVALATGIISRSAPWWKSVRAGRFRS